MTKRITPANIRGAAEAARYDAEHKCADGLGLTLNGSCA